MEDIFRDDISSTPCGSVTGQGSLGGDLKKLFLGKSMQRKTWLLIALAYFVFAELLSWVPVHDLSYCIISAPHTEQPTNDGGQKYCPPFHVGVAIFAEEANRFLETYDKSVVGAFTIVLAISTIGLWLATNKLWEAGERQLKLLSETSAAQSRDMQASLSVASASAAAAQASADHVPKTERAYLFLELDLKSNIYQLYQSGVTASDSPRSAFVEFGFQNHGRTPAIVESLQVTAKYWPMDNAMPPAMGLAPQLPIQPGLVVGTIPVRGYRAKFNVTQANYEKVVAGEGVFLFWGRIIYRDVFQELHETGWCRVTACDGKGWLFGEYENLNHYT